MNNRGGARAGIIHGINLLNWALQILGLALWAINLGLATIEGHKNARVHVKEAVLAMRSSMALIHESSPQIAGSVMLINRLLGQPQPQIHQIRVQMQAINVAVRAIEDLLMGLHRGFLVIVAAPVDDCGHSQIQIGLADLYYALGRFLAANDKLSANLPNLVCPAICSSSPPLLLPPLPSSPSVQRRVFTHPPNDAAEEGEQKERQQEHDGGDQAEAANDVDPAFSNGNENGHVDGGISGKDC